MTMQIIYAQEELPERIVKSIFLAGPTPRSDDGNPWRQDALQLLEDKGFDGTVFIPEPRDGQWHSEYDRQVEWEERCLNVADALVFWVPRDLETMPGYTTNIEYGTWMRSNKPMVLGYPEDAPKMSYMAHYAEKLNIPIHHSLTAALEAAIEKLGEGSLREGGDRFIPLYIWELPSFQAWHKAQTEVGNRIEHATVRYTYRVRSGFIFVWVISMDIWVEAEQRIKKHDFVLARTDISAVMLWKPEEPIENSQVVLVAEFRPSVSNQDAYIHELPSGSSSDPKQDEDPLTIAVHETGEETGFWIDQERFRFHGARQLASTLSSHKSHLFSVKLTDKELEWFKSQVGLIKGNADEGERTHIEIRSIKEIWEGDLLDWTTLGQILTVAKQE